MKILWVAAAMLLLSSSAQAIECQTSGKAWRLIDGKKCWHMGHRSTPKRLLHWRTKHAALPGTVEPMRRPKPRIMPTPPEPNLTPSEPDLNAIMQARAAARVQSVNVTELRVRNDNPPPPPPPVVETVLEPKVVAPVRIVHPGAPIAVPKTTPKADKEPVKEKASVPTGPSMLMPILMVLLLIGNVITAKLGEQYAS